MAGSGLCPQPSCDGHYSDNQHHPPMAPSQPLAGGFTIPVAQMRLRFRETVPAHRGAEAGVWARPGLACQGEVLRDASLLVPGVENTPEMCHWLPPHTPHVCRGIEALEP